MNYDIFKLNQRKFDLIFGFVLLFGSPLLVSGRDLDAHPLFTGICGLLIYILEAWAFVFKVTVARVRVLQKNSHGYWPRDGGLPTLPPAIFIGRFLRALLRISVLLISLNSLMEAFHLDHSAWAGPGKSILILGLLVEVLIYRRVRIKNRETKHEKISEDQSREYSWRIARVDLLKDPHLLRKEIASDYILLVTAIMFTQTYWQVNWEFYRHLTDTVYEQNLNGGWLMVTMFIGVLITAAMIVLPARLAFYVEEKWNLDPAKAPIARKWSLAFAILMTILPFYAYVIAKFYL